VLRQLPPHHNSLPPSTPAQVAVCCLHCPHLSAADSSCCDAFQCCSRCHDSTLLASSYHIIHMQALDSSIQQPMHCSTSSHLSAADSPCCDAFQCCSRCHYSTLIASIASTKHHRPAHSGTSSYLSAADSPCCDAFQCCSRCCGCSCCPS
jgi:hypothetical protein